MDSISRHIDRHSAIKTHVDMSLKKNEIHEEGASYIAELLNNTRIVSAMSLGNNPIHDKGLQTIFYSLKRNNTLKVLDVSHCCMTEAGLPSLAEAMKLNTTLEKLTFLQQNFSLVSSFSLLSLLHCLYEAQSPTLFQLLAKQVGGCLDLSGTSLTPVV